MSQEHYKGLSTEVIVNKLKPLLSSDGDGLNEFKNKKLGEEFKTRLVSASPGIGECIDDRCCLEVNTEGFTQRNKEAPKPSFVGGAAGWVVMYMLQGKSLEDAVKLTVDLYQRMNWGEMQIHIDDNHGQIKDPNELIERKTGCGFLGVVGQVASVLKCLGLTQADSSQFKGEEIFDALRAQGAKVVALTGHHSQDAAFVINQGQENKTLPKDKLWEDEVPAFVWDMWATTGDDVLLKFNQVGGLSLSKEEFKKTQLAMHLATGLALGALKLDKGRSNLVVL